jgi:acyl-coenzyme A synthetase/AMP-(fatty) acid ligase
MGDRVRILEDGRFLLEGRGDRVIKVGEKRLSLPEMERRLNEHSWVEVAILLPLDQAGEVRVAAVVVPSAAGREQLAAEGRRGFGSGLAEHLSQEWDRVLLPRIWRTVDALPEDAQGKHPVALLQALFRDAQSGEG